ncbi:MAG TPA: AMP-binding protein [Candidatus Dormibacteraeota bacterium]|nr:AMP-binding protein [Candidatus Dormibacteraeota bacterium]
MATTVKTARTVAHVLETGAERWPDRTAIDFGVAAFSQGSPRNLGEAPDFAGKYTYRDLWSRGRRAAQAFADQGVKPGEPVLVMLDNTIEFVDAWLGLALIGAIQVPVNTEYLGEILRHQVKNSGAWLMLVDEAYVPRIDALGEDRGDLRCVRISGGSWAETFAKAKELPRESIATSAENDIVAIMYTSGTTGPSKGVRVAHAHAYTYAQHASQSMQLAEGDVYFAPLPLFHIAGQWALVYACLQVGATAIVRRRFSASDFWPTVRESGARVSFLLGAMANFLARQDPKPDDIDNPMERMLIVPLIDNADDFRKRFGVRVCTCYGSTEVNVPIISDYEVTEPGIAGRAIPGFEIRIVDENDREVPVGAVGELVVRADEPWVLATEYHRNPEASLRLFRNLWLHTGDAFRKDARDNYFFVDRIKDYIRRRGENISSFEVEREVNAHPAVLECAAVAVKSAATEDDLKVVVVLKSGASLEPEELRSFLRERVPKFMVPDVVEVIAELPKTPTGKIQKHLLR